jgi:alpha-tubulin suppressor-like RCC1 family protein
MPPGLSNVVGLAAGSIHSLALKSDGTVIAWGYNYYGQATVPAGLSNVVALAAGDIHSLALKSDGTVVAWGGNSSGQATVPGGLSNVAAIAGGGYHSLALPQSADRIQAVPPVSETVMAGTTASPPRVQVFDAYGHPVSGAVVRFVAPGSGAGGTFAGGATAALATTDIIGIAIAPALTANTTAGSYSLTASVAGIATPVTFTLTNTAPSTPVAWGANGSGESTVPAGLTNVLDVAAGGTHSLALKSDGTVAAWGSNTSGQTTVPAGLSSVVAVAAGVLHSLALKSDGTVAAWGSNTSGQTTVPAGLSSVVAVAAGSYHNLALKSNGTVVAWGNNPYGQATVPAGLSGVSVIAVAAGWGHSLALSSYGTVVAWGNNSYGQLNVPYGLSGVIALAAGDVHSLALTSYGTVVAWGDNTFGETTVPAGLSNVVAIAAGSYYSLALKSDGTVVAWGSNAYGASTVPAGLSNVVAIAAGGFHSLALTAVSTAQSTVSVSSSAVVYGATATLTLQLRDSQGNPLPHGGSNVSFGLGSGTGAGTIGTVIDHGDGTFTATFTATGVGTPLTITASINGVAVTSTLPTITVTPRTLHVTAAGQDKIYDGTTTATVTLSDDRLPSDTLTDTYGSASFVDKTVGTGKTVSVSVISISGASAVNYSLADTTASTAANITARALTISATGVNKVYDGTTAATVTLSDNRISGDSFTDGYTTAAFADKNVGTAKPVSVSGIGIGGADAGNYTFNTTASATADITPQALTGSVTASGKVYDASTAATISGRSLSGVLDSDQVSYVGGSATFADKNLATGKTVTATGLSLSGADAGNYTVNATATTTADITPRVLTISATGIDKVYDGTTAATVTLSDNRVAGDVFTAGYSSATFSDRNVGSGKTVTVSGLSLSGADASNYTFNTTGSTTADITARPITVTATASTKTYDGTLIPAMASLNTPREVSTATLLSNGKVLVTGGFGPSGKLASAELYDPDTNSWSPAGSMTAARAYHTATLLNSGKVLVTGGWGTNAFLASCELYDPATNSWTPAGTLAEVRYGHTATSLASGLVLVTGGRGSTLGALASAELYDPTTNSWSPTGALSMARYFHTATLLSSGQVLVTGGYGDSGYLSGAELYNPATRTWSPAGALATGRYGHTATLLSSGQVLVTGGVGPGGYTASVQLYDPATNSWSPAGALTAARAYHTATLLTSGQVLVTAGHGPSGYLASCELYDPASKTWSPAGSLTTARQTHTATLLNSGRVLVAAGYGPSGDLASFELYDPASNAWALPTIVPTITSGNLAAGETGRFTETFDTKNVGTGKTLTPAGIVRDASNADVTANYAITFQATTNGTILPRALTVSATGVNKVYDGTISATVTLADNRVAGDLLTESYTSASFVDKNVGSWKVVNVGGISVSGADAGNYTFNSTASTTADITARPLTVTATGINRIYDGTTAAAVSLADDRVGGDVLTVSYTDAQFGDKNVDTAKPVSVGGISISGADAGNYTFNTTASTAADITALEITGSITVANKVYDAGTAASVIGYSLAGAISGDDVQYVGGTATFADKNVGTGKPVTATGLSLSGADAGNYTVNSTAMTTADITARSLTVTAAASNKVYDGSIRAAVTLADNRQPGDDLTTTYTTAAFADKNVGTGKTVSISGIGIAGADAGNYTFNTTASTTADITAWQLTVAAHGVNKVYDGNTTATVTFTDDRVGGDAFAISYTASFADKNAAAGKTVSVNGISLSGTDAGNYTVNDTASTTADITPLGITGSITAENKVYDGTTTATIATRSLSGYVSGDDVSYIGGTATFADKNVGVGKVVTATGLGLAGTDAGNYTVNTTATTTADITTRSASVTPDAGSKIYGDTDPVLTGTLSNFVADDGVIASYSRTSGETVAGGPYTLIATLSPAAALVNYAITYNTANFTITPRSLTVAANDQSKVYGYSDPALTFTVGGLGLAGGDTQALVFSGELTRAAGENVGNYAISRGSLTANSNYALTDFTGADLAITTRPITMSAVAASKVYDGDTSSDGVPALIVGSLAGGDTPGFLQTYDDRNAGTGKTLTPSGLVIDGNGGGNYQVTFVSVPTGTITPRPITGSITAGNKVYDCTATATITDRSLSGMVGGDVVRYVGGTATFADKTVGTSKTVTATGLGLSGSDADNYTVNDTATTTADITPLAITGSITAASKVYDATVTATITGRTLTGVLSGDSVSYVGGTATFADKNVGSAKTVTAIGLSLMGADASNYTVNSTAATSADITAAPLTITASSRTKIYGQTVTFAGTEFTSTGLFTGDAVTSVTLTSAGAAAVAAVGSYPIVPSAAVGTGLSNYAITYVNGVLTVTVAGLSGSIYILNTGASGALAVSGNASLTVSASGRLMVDSNSSSAITVSGNAHLTHTTGIEVVGGLQRSGNAIVTGTVSHPAVVTDPLYYLTAPSYSGTPVAVNVTSGTVPIGPGLYSSIKVSGTGRLVMSSGVYVIAGGGLSVSGQGSITDNGSGVLIYNGGTDLANDAGTFGGIAISGNGTVSLTALVSDAYAGVVIFQSRHNTRALAFSGSALAGISGTIYAPTATAVISGNATLNSASFVVNSMTVSGNGSSNLAIDGTNAVDCSAGQLLGVDIYLYIDTTSNGGFTSAQLARVQDAITGIDALLSNYGVTIIVVGAADSGLANFVFDAAPTTLNGSAADGVLGSTRTTGEITIVQGWDWFTGSDPAAMQAGQYDFQTVVTHELGHALGLGHRADSSSVMYASLEPAQARRTLTAADLAVPDLDQQVYAHPLLAAPFVRSHPAGFGEPTLEGAASWAAAVTAVADFHGRLAQSLAFEMLAGRVEEYPGSAPGNRLVAMGADGPLGEAARHDEAPRFAALARAQAPAARSGLDALFASDTDWLTI